MKKKTLWIIAEITAFLFFLFYISPLILVLFNSSKAYNDIVTSPFKLPSDWSVLIQNIVTIFSDARLSYAKAYRSSIIITVVSVVITALLASMCAWAIVRSKSKFGNFVYYLFIASVVIPFQVIMYPMVSWFRTLGDHVTKPLFGFPMLRSYPGIIIAYIGFGMSMAVFLFAGFIKGIPREIEEAAEIDGASKFQTFTKVVFPMLRPVIITESLLQGLGIWNDYMLPLLLLGKDNDLQTIPLAISSLVRAYVVNWGMILTSTLLTMIPVIIIFLLCQKYIIRGMTDGAVKF